MNSTVASPGITVPWSMGDVAKAITLVIGGIMLLVLLGGLATHLNGGQGAVASLLFLGAPEGLLLLAVWRFGPWKFGQSWSALGLQAAFNKGASLALVVFLASIGFTILYAAIVAVLGLESLAPIPLPAELLETYPQRLLAFFLIVLVAPVAEEVFFRGFLLNVFIRSWGFLVGAVLTSLLFSLAHVAPSVIVPAFVAGMLLAWLYHRTGSLWNCCLAHGAQNAVAFAVTISA